MVKLIFHCLFSVSVALFCLTSVAAERWSSLAHVSFRHQLDSAFGGGYALTQDSTGFMWLGTQTGLVRWDGTKMRRFVADSSKSGSLPDNYILSLANDARGRLWIGTSTGGVARYDPINESFITFVSQRSSLSDTRISALSSDGRGGMWIGTGAGLEHIDADDRLFNAASGAPQLPLTALPKGGVEVLLRDSKNGLWIGTRQGLFRRSGDDEPLEEIELSSGTSGDVFINALYEDLSGRIWIGTRASGAFVVPTPGHKATKIEATKDERVYSIVEKSPGTIWLGTEGGGIAQVDPASLHVQRIRHQPDIQDSLQDDHVVALYKERSGQIFVVTEDALSQHDPRQQGVTTIRSVGQSGKLSVPNLLLRPNGIIWASNNGSAIAILDPLLGKIGEIVQGPAALPNGRILALANGPGDRVYIGTQQGLYQSDRGGKNIEHVRLPFRDAKAPVWALAMRGNVLWVGGHDGLWKIGVSPTDKTFAKLITHAEGALGDQRVTSILPIDDGSAWIGTRSGVAKMNSRGDVQRLPTDTADRTRLPKGYVGHLMLDRENRLWVGTFSSGIAVLTHTDKAGRAWFSRVDTGSGLPDNGVNVILQDRTGQVWASCDTGLVNIDPVTLNVISLGSENGLRVLGYWKDSGVILPAGEIMMGGTNGITVLLPGRDLAPKRTPNIAVTSLAVGQRALPAGRLNMPGSFAAITVPSELRSQGFSLEFATLDFQPAEESQAAYRLDNFDAEWVSVDPTARRVSYTNVPPGKYTLLLRTKGKDGTIALKSVLVQVLPSWYQHALFQLLIALIALTSIFLLLQFRTAMLRRRQRELESMVETRTVELRKIQSQLETLAYADPLTGLPNRRLFNDELVRMTAQARRSHYTFGLLLMDLDKFKAVNDTLGHDVGDGVLVIAADRIRMCIRETDIVARLGGDEFAVLLAMGTDLATVGHVCNRIVAAMAETIMFKENAIEISASIGVTLINDQHCSVEAAYKAADVALYKAKENGRNQWFFDTNDTSL